MCNLPSSTEEKRRSRVALVEDWEKEGHTFIMGSLSPLSFLSLLRNDYDEQAAPLSLTSPVAIQQNSSASLTLAVH